jgi:hypothetical protein
MKNKTTERPSKEDIAKIADKLGATSNIGNKRKFESGATRDLDEAKHDYEACLSPLVLERYGEYMLQCSYLSDGTRRPDDNWMKGIPITSYMKSMLRHVFHVWKLHRGFKVEEKGKSVDIETALCGVLFNTMGYLFELLKVKKEYNDR